MSNVETRLVLLYSDLTPVFPSWGIEALQHVIRFRALVPEIKISFFISPMYRWNSVTLHRDFTALLRELIGDGTVRLGLHGLAHDHREFANLDFNDARGKIQMAELELERANLPYTKVWMSPGWITSGETIQALESLDYTHVYLHPDRPVETTMITVPYSWDLLGRAPERPTIVAHGHVHDEQERGIGETGARVLQFINEKIPRFLFLDEV